VEPYSVPYYPPVSFASIPSNNAIFIPSSRHAPSNNGPISYPAENGNGALTDANGQGFNSGGGNVGSFDSGGGNVGGFDSGDGNGGGFDLSGGNVGGFNSGDGNGGGFNSGDGNGAGFNSDGGNGAGLNSDGGNGGGFDSTGGNGGGFDSTGGIGGSDSGGGDVGGFDSGSANGRDFDSPSKNGDFNPPSVDSSNTNNDDDNAVEVRFHFSSGSAAAFPLAQVVKTSYVREAPLVQGDLRNVPNPESAAAEPQRFPSPECTSAETMFHLQGLALAAAAAEVALGETNVIPPLSPRTEDVLSDDASPSSAPTTQSSGYTSVLKKVVCAPLPILPYRRPPPPVSISCEVTDALFSAYQSQSQSPDLFAN
jgi:hypothetical protein